MQEFKNRRRTFFLFFFLFFFLTQLIISFTPKLLHATGLALSGDIAGAWVNGSDFSPGEISPKLGVDIGLTVQKEHGYIGLFLDKYASGTYNFGGIFRSYFGENRLVWIQLKLDLLATLILLTQPSETYYVNQSYFDYAGYGFAFGFRIPFGSIISFQPYVAWDTFTFPFDGTQPINRYYCPHAGVRMVFSF